MFRIVIIDESPELFGVFFSLHTPPEPSVAYFMQGPKQYRDIGVTQLFEHFGGNIQVFDHCLMLLGTNPFNASPLQNSSSALCPQLLVIVSSEYSPISFSIFLIRLIGYLLDLFMKYLVDVPVSLFILMSLRYPILSKPTIALCVIQRTRNIDGVYVTATQDLGWLNFGIRMLRTMWDMKNTLPCIIQGDKSYDRKLNPIGRCQTNSTTISSGIGMNKAVLLYSADTARDLWKLNDNIFYCSAGSALLSDAVAVGVVVRGCTW